MKIILNFILSCFAVILILASCSCNSDAPKREAKLQVDKHIQDLVESKMKKDERLEKLKRMPNGEFPTRFSIYRMNDRHGSDDLVKNPYILKNNQGITFFGVAVDDVANEVADSVFLIINGRTSIGTNYGGNSDGFAEAAGDKKYNRAAFRIHIPTRKFRHGINEVKVMIVGHGSKYKFAPLRIYKVINTVEPKDKKPKNNK